MFLMKTLIEKFSTKLNSLQKLRPILYNYYYGLFNPVFVATIVLFFYYANFVVGGLCFLLIYCTLAMLIYDDVVPFIPTILIVPFMFRDLSLFIKPPIAFWIVVGLAVIMVIFHAIKFHPKRFSFGQLFIPLVAITVAFFTGGLLSPYLHFYTNGILLSITIGPLVLLIYSFFHNYVNPPKDFNFKKFFAQTLLFAGLVTSVQLIFRYFNMDLFSRDHIGWGNVNLAAIILLFAFPASFYLMGTEKNFLIYVFCAVGMLVATILSKGEGVLAILLACSPILLVFTYLKMPVQKRKAYNLACFVALISVLVGIIYLITSGYMQELWAKIIKTFTNDNGRSKLIRIAWKLFIDNPIFGVSMGYKNSFNYDPSGGIIEVFNFHSTPFHVLATMGLMGGLAYFFYFFVRFRILTDVNGLFNVCMFFCFACFELYGCLDPCEFVIMPNMIFATVLIAVVELINKNHKEPLPLMNHKNNNLLYDSVKSVEPIEKIFK